MKNVQYVSIFLTKISDSNEFCAKLFNGYYITLKCSCKHFMPICTFPSFLHSFIHYSVPFEQKSKINTQQDIMN